MRLIGFNRVQRLQLSPKVARGFKLRDRCVQGGFRVLKELQGKGVLLPTARNGRTSGCWWVAASFAENFGG